MNAGVDTRKRQSIRGIRFYKRQLWRYISSVCEADTLYCKKCKIYSDTRLFLRQRMKQENSQPVKQHKKKNGFADRKLLAGLVFAVGDYMALTLSACLALYFRNIVMTYNVYHINLSYIFSGFLCFYALYPVQWAVY